MGMHRWAAAPDTLAAFQAMGVVVYGTPALDTVTVKEPWVMAPAPMAVVTVHTALLRDAGHWMLTVDTGLPYADDREYLRHVTRHTSRPHITTGRVVSFKLLPASSRHIAWW
jgi:hypothetical protein